MFKKAMKIAVYHTGRVSPDTLKQNSWIPTDSPHFDDYWQALQVVRDWTKENHNCIHNLGFETASNYWNEHNFVFKRNGVYYHAKGTTPSFKYWAEDSTDKVIIPLNMAEPILIVEGTDNPNSLGFCPHGGW